MAALPTAEERRAFLYMPYMHSESRVVQAEGAPLFDAIWGAGEEPFGCYPHRNAILGRTSTPAELEFLEGPDSSF